jgi:hypothetical protein
MRTLFVTYRGMASDRFDREYFLNKHLPLAREIAEPLGMLSIEALFRWTQRQTLSLPV